MFLLIILAIVILLVLWPRTSLTLFALGVLLAAVAQCSTAHADTLFRAAGTGECFGTPAVNPPSAAVQTQPAAPFSTEAKQPAGGGGSFDTWAIVFLAMLVVWKVASIKARREFHRWYAETEKFVRDQDATIQRMQTELDAANATIKQLERKL